MKNNFKTSSHLTEKEISSTPKFCNKCGYEYKENETVCPKCNDEKLNEYKESSIKNFILRIGRFIVDFNVIIGFCIAILIGIFILFTAFIALLPTDNGLYDNSGFAIISIILAVLIPIIIIFGVIIANYFLYLLIDIRDNIHKFVNIEDKNDKV